MDEQSQDTKLNSEETPKLSAKPLRPMLVIGGWIAGLTLMMALLAPLVLKAREAARRTSNKNNLKQIGLALHNYHDVHAVLPPGGSIREDGTPHHGWMTSVMPYLDSSPLYSMIDFNAAWDHPFNIDVFTHQYPMFLNPSNPQPTSDNFFCITHYMANPAFMHRNSSVSFNDLTTGTSHNWMVGGIAGGFQPAAYPFNWRVWDGSINHSPNGYGTDGQSGVHFLMADGSVRWISKESSLKHWREYSKPDFNLNDIKYAVPARAFPERTKLENWSSESTADGYVSIVAVQKEGSVELLFRAFPRDRNSYDEEITAAVINLAFQKYPKARQITLQESLDPELLQALKQFKNLSVIYTVGITAEAEVIERLESMPHLKSIHLQTIHRETFETLKGELADVQITCDNVRE